MDPITWFIYDQFLDPGKHQCKDCGALFDKEDQCIEWSEEDNCMPFECLDCGAVGQIEERNRW